MQKAKELERWRFYVVNWDDETVWLSTGEEEIETPRRKFVGMFGRKHLVEGRYGTMVIKQRADGSVSMRAWPWTRRWTEEDIAAANKRADELADAWKTAFGDDVVPGEGLEPS